MTKRICFNNALATAVLAVLCLGAVSVAEASVTVCNRTGISIWYTQGFTDTATCANWGNIRLQPGWFFLTNNQCVVTTNTNMTNKRLYSYAIAADGSFEWNGGDQFTWSVPQANAFNGCLTNIQLQCSNHNANCATRKMRRSSVINGANLSVDYLF